MADPKEQYLVINGEEVKVDKSFFDLTPEQQQAEVEHISAQLEKGKPSAEVKDTSASIPMAPAGGVIGAAVGPAVGPAVSRAVDMPIEVMVREMSKTPNQFGNYNTPDSVKKWLATQTSNPYAGGRTQEEAYEKSEIRAGKPTQSRRANIPIRKGNLSEPSAGLTIPQKTAQLITQAEKVGTPGVGRRMFGMGVAGAELGQAGEELSKGNYGRAALSGLGALGGAASQSHIKPVRAVGTGVAAAVPIIQKFFLPNEVEQQATGGLVHLANGGQPEFGEARAYEPSYSEKIRDFAARYMSPEQADVLFGGPRASMVDEFNPIGMALRTPGAIADAAKGFYQSGEEGNYLGGMGHYLTGAMNVAPMIKPGAQVAKTAAKELGPKAADLIENYLAKIGGIQYAVPPKPKKFSEVIEPFIGTHSLHPTIVDTTKLDLAAKRMAGPEAAHLQNISPIHKETGWSWANDSMGAATKLYNIGKNENQLITGLIGSPTQLKTNRSVFGELADEYFKAIKEGKMTPELQAKIQARLPTLTHGKEKIQTFPTAFDIRDRDAFNEMAKGFHQRGHLADIMGGKGVSQGVPGGGKIIPYMDILTANTEPILRGAPTHSVGTRLFTVGDKPPEYRPDLHNAFDYANFGKVLSDQFAPAPKEFAYPDEIARIRANLAKRGIGRDVTAMDLMRNTINQPITEKLWRNAQDAGY